MDPANPLKRRRIGSTSWIRNREQDSLFLFLVIYFFKQSDWRLEPTWEAIHRTMLASSSTSLVHHSIEKQTIESLEGWTSGAQLTWDRLDPFILQVNQGSAEMDWIKHEDEMVTYLYAMMISRFLGSMLLTRRRKIPVFPLMKRRNPEVYRIRFQAITLSNWLWEYRNVHSANRGEH